MDLTVVGFRMSIEAYPNANETLVLEMTNGEAVECDPATLPPEYRDKLIAWLDGGS